MENTLSDYAGFDGITENIREELRKSFMEAVLLDVELDIKYPMPLIL